MHWLCAAHLQPSRQLGSLAHVPQSSGVRRHRRDTLLVSEADFLAAQRVPKVRLPRHAFRRPRTGFAALDGAEGSRCLAAVRASCTTRFNGGNTFCRHIDSMPNAFPSTVVVRLVLPNFFT